MVPLTSFRTVCGEGSGLAACPSLGLLVTSCDDDNTLHVHQIPASVTWPSCKWVDVFAPWGVIDRDGLVHLDTLGGPESPQALRFKFVDEGGVTSGHLAFTSACHLLVTDAGHGAVHVVDVVGRAHVGYVAAPGAVAGPRGVASRGTLTAVTAWGDEHRGDHVVLLFEGSDTEWSLQRVVAGGFGSPGRGDGQLRQPKGLRFTSDGRALVVADGYNGRASMFRVSDGVFVCHAVSRLGGYASDVESCEGGWLVAFDFTHDVVFVPCPDEDLCTGGGGGSPGKMASEAGFSDDWKRLDGRRVDAASRFESPMALALVPGIGLFLREWRHESLRLFATPDAIIMGAMSPARAAWMVGVVRVILRRTTGSLSRKL